MVLILNYSYYVLIHFFFNFSVFHLIFYFNFFFLFSFSYLFILIFFSYLLLFILIFFLINEVSRPGRRFKTVTNRNEDSRSGTSPGTKIQDWDQQERRFKTGDKTVRPGTKIQDW